MSATASLAISRRSGAKFQHPVAAATTTLIGVLAALNADNHLVLATDAAARRVVGLFIQEVDNSAGAAAAESADVELGCFLLKNSATNALTDAHIGKVAFVEDNETVASDPGVNAVVAGIVAKVTADGVWVHVGVHLARVPATITALAALTSTNGTMAAAADDAAVKVEGEKIGDDARALHATLTTIITGLKAQGLLK